MKIYVVIGKIGSGKSTVCTMMRDTAIKLGLNTRRLDLDDIAKQVIEGDEIKPSLQKAFGVYRDNSELAKRAFASIENAQKINSIVHPIVYKKLQELIDEVASKIDVLIIEESAYIGPGDPGTNMADCVVCVSTPFCVREKLVIARGMDLDDFLRRDALQPKQCVMEQEADVVISNANTVDDLKKKIESMFKDCGQ